MLTEHRGDEGNSRKRIEEGDYMKRGEDLSPCGAKERRK